MRTVAFTVKRRYTLDDAQGISRDAIPDDVIRESQRKAEHEAVPLDECSLEILTTADTRMNAEAVVNIDFRWTWNKANPTKADYR